MYLQYQADENILIYESRYFVCQSEFFLCVKEVTDLARRVTCLTSASNLATLSFKPIMVDMLDIVSIPVGDETIECWMDIQRGRYPEVSF